MNIRRVMVPASVFHGGPDETIDTSQEVLPMGDCLRSYDNRFIHPHLDRARRIARSFVPFRLQLVHANIRRHRRPSWTSIPTSCKSGCSSRDSEELCERPQRRKHWRLALDLAEMAKGDPLEVPDPRLYLGRRGPDQLRSRVRGALGLRAYDLPSDRWLSRSEAMTEKGFPLIAGLASAHRFDRTDPIAPTRSASRSGRSRARRETSRNDVPHCRFTV